MNPHPAQEASRQADDEHHQIRISQIAGRYLVFDVRDISLLRRNHSICAVLTGTTPQHPSQNIFFSIPLELSPEEVHRLISQGNAHVIDDTVSHTMGMGRMDVGDAARKEYINTLRHYNANAQLFMSGRKKQRLPDQRHMMPKQVETPTSTTTPPKTSTLAVTSTTSNQLVAVRDGQTGLSGGTSSKPLVDHLLDRGYYLTPGLRFGAQYSVYPGDPLRFHAHFLANQYDWDEEIPLLDLVGTGRLATGVKKGFLIAGQPPECKDGTIAHNAEVRAFCIEWAGM